MGFWIALWKTVFIVTVSVFSVVAVWVTFQGARDIKIMLAGIRARHDENKDSAQN